MKRSKCRKNDHDYRPIKKRGTSREKCTKCGDVFPCHHDCEHLDCCAATGREMPEWCSDPVQAREAMLAELAIIAPTTVALAKRKRRAKRVKLAPVGMPVTAPEPEPEIEEVAQP